MTFKDLGLHESLLRALDNEGYTHPTPIQEKAIPIALDGADLIGCAQTGTGKTAAFSLPTLQYLLENPTVGDKVIRTLVLAPTRELAIQIDESLRAYSRYTPIRSAVIFGGVPVRKQIGQLRKGIDMLVATPGRLLDLINQRHVDLRHVDTLILDEADRMLDMGFIHDINRIVRLLPEKRQTILFSATVSREIQQIADQFMYKPENVTIELDAKKQANINESFYFVEKTAKSKLLRHLIREQSIEKCIVFTRTKYGADKLARHLSKASIPADAIHGNKSQSQRQRVLDKFRKGSIQILVASDVAARGIDIDDITHVINYEIPEQAETYVHRIGRTGRAGSDGIAISFCADEEKKYMFDIEALLNKRIPIVEDHPYVEEINYPTNHNPRRPSGGSNGNGHSKPRRPAAGSRAKHRKPHYKSAPRR